MRQIRIDVPAVYLEVPVNLPTLHLQMHALDPNALCLTYGGWT